MEEPVNYMDCPMLRDQAKRINAVLTTYGCQGCYLSPSQCMFRENEGISSMKSFRSDCRNPNMSSKPKE